MLGFFHNENKRQTVDTLYGTFPLKFNGQPADTHTQNSPYYQLAGFIRGIALPSGRGRGSGARVRALSPKDRSVTRFLMFALKYRLCLNPETRPLRRRRSAPTKSPSPPDTSGVWKYNRRQDSQCTALRDRKGVLNEEEQIGCSWNAGRRAGIGFGSGRMRR